LLRLTRFEWVLWDKGILHVAGVDEAGLSPLAGPASAAASFPVRVFPALMIQKKLNAAERERLAAEIKRTAVAWSVGFADVSEIDTINIYWASQLAVKRALAGLLVRPGHVLVDGRRIQDMKIAQQPIIKGDAKSLTIAAASILAKTARDALMYI
jgi:ribonuclease HII